VKLPVTLRDCCTSNRLVAWQ